MCFERVNFDKKKKNTRKKPTIDPKKKGLKWILKIPIISFPLVYSKGFIFQLCGVAKLVIIHEKIYPNSIINQIWKSFF